MIDTDDCDDIAVGVRVEFRETIAHTVFTGLVAIGECTAVGIDTAEQRLDGCDVAAFVVSLLDRRIIV